MRSWTNISSTMGLKLMQWFPPNKFTHSLWPSSSMKKKLSLTLTSFSNLTGKDLSLKLKKEWIQRQRRRMGKCNVRLDQRTCYYGKSQKLHMSCAHVIAASKHININYMQYVHLVYTLDYVSNECIKSH